MLLLIAAGSGVAALALHEATKDSELTEQPSAGTYRSRVFDVSPTYGAERRQAEDAAGPDAELHGTEGTPLPDSGSGTWLSDSLAQLEESYQAMRHQGEELAQDALHTLADGAPLEPTTASVAATPVVPIEHAPAVALEAMAPSAAGDDQQVHAAASTEQLGAATATTTALDPNTALVGNAPLVANTTQPTAPDGSALDPAEAARRTEQARIAVELEKHQAFIISLLPLFLPVPAAADASAPTAAAAAAPIPLVDMSGLAWGPVDLAGTSSP